jgi:hypothetical protein
MRNIAISWILYALRVTCGLTTVRNHILNKKINKLGKYSKNEIMYGQTFTQGNKFSDIHKMVYDFQGSDKCFLIFTSNGEIMKNNRKRVRFSDIESHYVSFIIDKKNMIATIIDPSRNNGKIGIYNPYIGIEMQPFFEELGYKTKWLETTSPCQINYHDVFCQSWTMYLIYKFMKNDMIDEKIYIPKNQSKKYSKLLDFFKNLSSDENFSNELKISYLESIKNHDNKIILKNYNPYSLLLQMLPEDMYE